MTEETANVSTTSEATTETSQSTPVASESAENGNTQVEAQSPTETNVEPMTVDDLMNITSEQYEEFGDTNHSGMRPLHEVMKHIPEDARKHLANIRRSYTTKTQELAQQRKELEQAMAAHKKEMSLVYDNDLNKRLTEITSNEEQFDIYSEDGMKAQIQREAAKMMQEMLKPAREKMQQDSRRLELQQFKAEHPDLTHPDYKMEIAQTLMQRPELKLEDAYYLTKAKVDAKKLKAERELVATQKQERRDALLKTSSGSATSAQGTPKFRDAWQAYQYFAALKNKQ